MSKKTSPQARSVRRPRSRGPAEATSARVSRGTSRAAKAAVQAPETLTMQQRARKYFPAVAIPIVIVVSVLVTLALATLLFTNSTLIALPAFIAQLWLLINAAPVSGASATLEAIPAVPAIGFGVLMARRVHKAVKDRVSLADLYVLSAYVLGVPILLTITAWGMLLDASSVLPVDTPPLLLAIGRTFGLHLAALVIGMGPRLWRALGRRYSIPNALFDAVSLSLKALVALMAVGGVALLVSLAMHWQVVSDLMKEFSAGGVAGLWTLSVLYLPNAMLAAVSILIGGEFQFGEAVSGLFGTFLVPLPPLPLLAALPASLWPYAWGLIVVPVLVLAFVFAKWGRGVEKPYLVGALAALILALEFAYLTFMMFGKVGIYGFVGPTWWLLAGLVFLAALVVAGITGLAQQLFFRESPSDEEDVTDEYIEEEAVVEQSDSEELSGEDVPEGENVEKDTEDIKEQLENEEEGSMAVPVGGPEAFAEAAGEEDTELDSEPDTEPDSELSDTEPSETDEAPTDEVAPEDEDDLEEAEGKGLNSDS